LNLSVTQGNVVVGRDASKERFIHVETERTPAMSLATHQAVAVGACRRSPSKREIREIPAKAEKG